MPGMRPERRRDRQVLRLIGILKRLQAGARLTPRQLAQEFGVRRETIYRDLLALQDIGFPLVGDEVGGWRQIALDPAFRVPSVGLTDREVAALTWAIRQAGGGPQPFAAVLPQLRRKLTILGQEKGRAFVERLDAAVSTAGPGRTIRELSASVVESLVEAITTQRRVTVEYEPPGASARPTRLRFDPYLLRLVQGALYCVGRVADGVSVVASSPMTSMGGESVRGRSGGPSGLTVLSVHRITAVGLTQEQFVVARDFDPARYDEQVFGVLAGPPLSVVIRFAANIAPYIRAREWHPSQKGRELPDGRFELAFRAGGASEITHWIMGWGDAAEVVSPPELRQRVATALAAAAAVYRSLPAQEGRNPPPATRAVRSRKE